MGCCISPATTINTVQRREAVPFLFECSNVMIGGGIGCSIVRLSHQKAGNQVLLSLLFGFPSCRLLTSFSSITKGEDWEPIGFHIRL